ncbi:Protein of unknown function [Pyronema omphalodes CBS 100304]|uniref:Uncharacterized protein n=1 Tax=Pyronema omphalodes (strain CBS 100304) TaxID=1076935 RepID=U4L9P1_PYROM|nr:Protein of unknown function [Pyronema omphalodes CBS 100304]
MVLRRLGLIVCSSRLVGGGRRGVGSPTTVPDGGCCGSLLRSPRYARDGEWDWMIRMGKATGREWDGKGRFSWCDFGFLVFFGFFALGIGYELVIHRICSYHTHEGLKWLRRLFCFGELYHDCIVHFWDTVTRPID